MREFFSLALLREKVTDEKTKNFLVVNSASKQNNTQHTHQHQQQQQQQQHGLKKKTRRNPRDSGLFSL